MDVLWSPWRYRYIAGLDRQDDLVVPPDCPFCRIPAESRDVDNFVLYRGRHNFVILNIHPYINGHTMVVPYAHVATLGALPTEAGYEMFDLTRHLTEILTKEYRAMGCNVGMNLGQAAGAGIADHLHMHIMPRWLGDVNFITTIGETRVLPEELATTYARLRPYFDHYVPADQSPNAS
ncbi:MAG: HIT domain-containing protein [Chloracidobacterium sp.]|uniref:HIT domain-containing protein n=1 Tax=Chloracidobacterium validum TaxID=2821543 RepID=A0ABX8BB52_9BACT|nr:HIT domain-containing protein [Chloracidobacterium validum]QUW02980.1 HIT domain-containing protein [Chloracidobacterium validum]